MGQEKSERSCLLESNYPALSPPRYLKPFSPEEEAIFVSQWSSERLTGLATALQGCEEYELEDLGILLENQVDSFDTTQDPHLKSSKIQQELSRATGLTGPELALISRVESRIGPLNLSSLVRVIPKIRSTWRSKNFAEKAQIAIAQDEPLDIFSAPLSEEDSRDCKELFSKRLKLLAEISFRPTPGPSFLQKVRTYLKPEKIRSISQVLEGIFQKKLEESQTKAQEDLQQRRQTQKVREILRNFKANLPAGLIISLQEFSNQPEHYLRSLASKRSSFSAKPESLAFLKDPKEQKLAALILTIVAKNSEPAELFWLLEETNRAALSDGSTEIAFPHNDTTLRIITALTKELYFKILVNKEDRAPEIFLDIGEKIIERIESN